ncbi:MAG: ankyrin repeat domain-containing protein [Planctomycetota bacterium]|jgi:ankyrin repeat protein
MKLSLNLMLGIAVVLFFGLLFAGLLMYRPLKMRWYISKLTSDDAKVQVDVINRLLGMGEEGEKILKENFPDGEVALEFLLEYWDEPDEFFGISGDSVLHLAVEEEYAAVCRILVGRGVDVTVKNKLGYTPLHVAAELGYTEVARSLLVAGASVDARMVGEWTPLHLAANEGFPETARVLIEGSADVNARGTEGSTPLHWAVEKDHVGLVHVIISGGANVNSRADCGETPLHRAVLVDFDGRIVRFLLSRGANPELKNSIGQTPLDLVDGRMDYEVVADILRTHSAK